MDYRKKGLKRNGTPRKGFWKLKDGGVIKISEMEDLHLLNSKRLLERMASAKHELENVRPYLNIPWTEGSVAYDIAQEQLDDILQEPTDYGPKWYELSDEAYRRGLKDPYKG